VIDLLRVNPCGRDIGVDSLATELVIDRRLAHGATLYGRVCGGSMHMGVDRMWMWRTISATGVVQALSRDRSTAVQRSGP
jgi:hypothetical protein